jgi:hypothetical protein
MTRSPEAERGDGLQASDMQICTALTFAPIIISLHSDFDLLILEQGTTATVCYDPC